VTPYPALADVKDCDANFTKLILVHFVQPDAATEKIGINYE
jgi:hypothetical protein